jgi:TPR repeat protein
LEKDAKEAAKWFKKAAEQGNAKGQVALGYLYSSGDGGHAEDHLEALCYFQAAANDGNAIAQYALGECYLHGKGVEEDLKLAHQCFVSASNEIPRAGVLAAMAERLLSEQQSEMKKNAGRSSDG